MATIKVNGTSYFISSSKITTPSIKINGQGYIPLFSGNKNSTVDYNRYRYTLGELKVGSYRAAVSRSFINHAPTVSISSSSGYLHSGDGATLQATASDPDGDRLTYEWFRYENDIAQSQYIEGGVNNALIFVNETASSSNTTRHYWCRVTDPYGASATSNVETITWYKPNHSPRIVISDYPSESTDGNIQFTITCYDEDNDSNCTVTYGYRSYGSGGSLNDHQTYSLTHMNATASGARTTGRTVSATKQGPDTSGNYWYYIYATITDSYGDTSRDGVRIKYTAPTPTYAYKCTVECWKEEHEREGYSIAPITWNVKVTANRYPSSCEGICLFANNGDGTGWIYKSEQVEFWRDSQPSTVQLVPYVTFNNTITETETVWVGYGVSGNKNGWKETTVSKTIQDRKSAGTNKTVAVSFPDAKGYANRITTTYEWN